MNRDVTFEVAGKTHTLRFNHTAFFQAEQATGLGLREFADQLDAKNSRILEAALAAGLEGHRVRTSSRPTPYTTAEVRAILDEMVLVEQHAVLSRAFRLGALGSEESGGEPGPKGETA